MKKLIVILLVFIAIGAKAQEYKIAKKSRLELHVPKATIEGHNGTDIIFTLSNGKSDKDERAEGLTAINSLGLKDNTGLGLSVTDKDDVISVYNLKKNNSPDIRILVPKGVIVSLEHEGVQAGNVEFKNMDNEIEVSVQYNSVNLDNVTGPLTIRTIYGHVEAKLGANVKDISIVSIYGYVDVALPIATKANLRLDTSYGEILVDPDFKIDFDSRRDGDRVSGKLNGGGVSISMDCNYGKVYLRKK